MGLDVTTATKPDAKEMTSISMQKADRDEDFNTRLASYRGGRWDPESEADPEGNCATGSRRHGARGRLRNASKQWTCCWLARFGTGGSRTRARIGNFRKRTRYRRTLSAAALSWKSRCDRRCT